MAVAGRRSEGDGGRRLSAMTPFWTLSALIVSLTGLAHLAATDPKRRRAFKLPIRHRRFARSALTLVFVPGVVLLLAGQGAAFVIWLGAATVAGWLVALRVPSGTAGDSPRTGKNLSKGPSHRPSSPTSDSPPHRLTRYCYLA